MRPACCAGVLVLSMSGAAASGAVIAYEGFPYAPGPLLGRGPGNGFVGPWNANPGVQVTVPGLSSPLAQPSIGNSVSGFFDYEAPLITPIINRDFWASFLVFHAAPNDQTYMGLTQTGIPLGNPPLIASGIRLGQYGIFNSAGGFIPAATPFTPAGSTDFLLTHWVPGGASYIVSLYVNPVSLFVPSLVVNMPLLPYDAVECQNQASFMSDELRIGDTATDAGFVPAPGAALMLVVLGLGRRRR